MYGISGGFDVCRVSLPDSHFSAFNVYIRRLQPLTVQFMYMYAVTTLKFEKAQCTSANG